MKTIYLHTLLPFFTNGSGSSTISAAMKTEAKDALRNGALNKPVLWTFSGTHNVYGGGSSAYTDTIGPYIEFYAGAGTLAVYSSAPANIELFVSSMQSQDTFTFSEFHLYAYGTKYITTPSTTTISHGQQFRMQHVLQFDYSTGGELPGADALANAFRTGTCNKLDNMKYALSTTGSTLHSATNFSWLGSDHSNPGTYYTATAETPVEPTGTPNNLKLYAGGTLYASATPNTMETVEPNTKFKFQFTISI